MRGALVASARKVGASPCERKSPGVERGRAAARRQGISGARSCPGTRRGVQRRRLRVRGHAARARHPDPQARGCRCVSGPSQLVVEQWPSYVAFALSFANVGIVWTNHHLMFSQFVRTNRVVVSLNLLLLMLVAFLPVPTAVLGSWIVSGRDRPTAVLLYGGVFFSACENRPPPKA